MSKYHIINNIIPDSIANELEIEVGDKLLEINNQEIKDVFDYYYQTEKEILLLLIEKPDGEQWELEIEKDEDEDLGIIFSDSLMDEYRSCQNNCIFCFIDQMPSGMRDTLYFKDDDSRLSFLQGNYITLTNITEDEIKRIIDYRLEPINISFHTTNHELRCKMLNNSDAGTALEKVKSLAHGRIKMNGQIVLCKGVNDGGELENTLSDLFQYTPYLQSVSIVPVGITRYRDNLYPLEPFTQNDARGVIKTIRKWQEKSLESGGNHFLHGSDEWYLLAEEDLPEEETYDDYLQLENGVGMLRLFIDEVNEELEKHQGDNRERNISLVTGVLAAPYLYTLSLGIQMKYPNVNISIYPINNKFFGELITVSGLITGQDIINQLEGEELGDKLLLPINMLKNEEEVFLDDITLEELSKALQVPVNIVELSGSDFVSEVINYD
jgi:putative radical SAM enzyme (TIGR03279 family)